MDYYTQVEGRSVAGLSGSILASQPMHTLESFDGGLILSSKFIPLVLHSLKIVKI